MRKKCAIFLSSYISILMTVRDTIDMYYRYQDTIEVSDLPTRDNQYIDVHDSKGVPRYFRNTGISPSMLIIL